MPCHLQAVVLGEPLSKPAAGARGISTDCERLSAERTHTAARSQKGHAACERCSCGGRSTCGAVDRALGLRGFTVEQDQSASAAFVPSCALKRARAASHRDRSGHHLQRTHARISGRQAGGKQVASKALANAAGMTCLCHPALGAPLFEQRDRKQANHDRGVHRSMAPCSHDTPPRFVSSSCTRCRRCPDRGYRSPCNGLSVSYL